MEEPTNSKSEPLRFPPREPSIIWDERFQQLEAFHRYLAPRVMTSSFDSGRMFHATVWTFNRPFAGNDSDMARAINTAARKALEYIGGSKKWERFLEYADAFESSNAPYQTLCIAHMSHTPNISINRDRRVVVCFAGFAEFGDTGTYTEKLHKAMDAMEARFSQTSAWFHFKNGHRPFEAIRNEDVCSYGF